MEGKRMKKDFRFENFGLLGNTIREHLTPEQIKSIGKANRHLKRKNKKP
jgi:hypothetical protein